MEVKNLNLATHNLIRYAFGGYFAAFLAATISPDAIGTTVGALGSVLSAVAALLIGVGIYVLHRYFVASLVLFPLRRLFIHLAQKKFPHDSTMQVLAGAGVPFLLRQATLSGWLARRGEAILGEHNAERDRLRRAELNILYISAVELFIASFFAANSSWHWWLPGAIILLATLVVDAVYHAELGRWMKSDPQPTGTRDAPATSKT